VGYGQQRVRFGPCAKLVEPQEGVSADVVELARLCETRGKSLYVLVNNKAEGSAPLSLAKLAEEIASVFDTTGPDPSRMERLR